MHTSFANTEFKTTCRLREDAEEGELPDEVQVGWSGAERAFGWLNLAIWDSLCGDAAAALADCSKAAVAAAGHPQASHVQLSQRHC